MTHNKRYIHKGKHPNEIFDLKLVSLMKDRNKGKGSITENIYNRLFFCPRLENLPINFETTFDDSMCNYDSSKALILLRNKNKKLPMYKIRITRYEEK